MNVNKARDFYSDYFEGTLESGLKQAFERALREDATIQAEYQAFTRAMEALGTMKDEEIEVPYDLHDRISARLDKHIWDQKQKAKPNFFSAWWRTLAVGGLATVAIIATVTTLFNTNSGRNSTANAIPISGGQRESVQFAGDHQSLIITAGKAGGGEISMVPERGDTVMMKLDSPMNRPIQNIEPQSMALIVRTKLGKEKFTFVLPGKDAKPVLTGEGDALDIAGALADTFQRPVQVLGGTDKSPWNLNGIAVERVNEAKIDKYAASLSGGIIILKPLGR
ncbi:MAG: hypothetical protein JST40_10220 [Armatimonadetes bacterium]|nr:hypothetical protein [Armatimonadota bacterium]